MTFDRQRPEGGWTLGSVWDPNEAEETDARWPFVPDALHGGTYAPDGTLHVGGKGVQDGYSTTIALASGTTATVSGLDTRRIFFTNGGNVTGTISLQFNADTNGAWRIITIDKVKSGVDVRIRDENNAVIAFASWDNHDEQQRVLVILERLSGAWVCTHTSSSLEALYSQDIYGDPPQSPEVNALTKRSSWWGTSSGLNGTFVFKLPTLGAAGMQRTAFFPRINGGTTLQFNWGESNVHTYVVSGAGERNTTLTFEYASGWKIKSRQHSPRLTGTQTLTIDSIGTDTHSIDTDVYDAVSVNSIVSYLGQPNGAHFSVREPLFEGQELTIKFLGVVGVNFAPQIIIHLPNAGNVTLTWTFSPRTTPYQLDGEDLKWGGDNPGIFRLRVIDNGWTIAGLNL